MTSCLLMEHAARTEFTVISVVTPSYNQEQFLEETIESVISQEGTFYIDYIIVDGGSFDGSVEIIKRYQSRLNSGTWPVKCCGISYRWTSEQDRGQADAIRKGLLQARGTVLAWLNSDDFYLPGALQAVTNLMTGHPEISLCYGDSNYCDESGVVIGKYPAENFNLSRLPAFNFIPQPSTFFQKSAYEIVGGLDDSLHFVMDFDLFCKIANKSNCYYLQQQLSCYRLHDAAKTVREEGLYDNHEEALKISMKHFAWAPFNLVYGTCACYWSRKIAAEWKYSWLLIIPISLWCALFRSLWLNRGIDRRDFDLLNWQNVCKLFKSRREILLG